MQNIALNLQARQGHAGLPLVLAFAVSIGDFAFLVSFEEQHLRDAFVRINFCGQGSRVADFNRDVTFPTRFERRDVDDDARARISRFTETDAQHFARDAEVFDRTCQRERIWRNDGNVGFDVDERILCKVLGVNHRRVDVGENLELIRDPQIVAVGG